MTDHVRVETREGVRVITIDRPEKKNALTGAMYRALADALGDTADDPAVGAVLIRGAPGAFTAGNDLADFAAAAAGGDVAGPILTFLRALATVETPLVAAVDGLAIGVGTTLLLHCDLVFASDRSVFRTPFTDLGLTPEAASSLLGPRLMGHQRAFELLVAGLAFDAAKAEAAGLVNRVLPQDRLEGEAFAAAAALAAKPRRAVAIARRLLKGDPMEVLQRIDEEAALFTERLQSAEAQAAFRAFLTRA
ncbi:crotonase/enoyl-CoA hydratase family protein [Chthonobacter rhizosphaerae]|uniref:crotonase/enoyl-CoA hydratase family protein n=1 Tax=Chthonobacter rhizosphaerae TaxID=2735553 RepID=UPI0015EF9CE5|nr:crotonase/enoyl-CoA hydratase family protein [Chthonobacter rhizosphaerae]